MWHWFRKFSTQRALSTFQIDPTIENLQNFLNLITIFSPVEQRELLINRIHIIHLALQYSIAESSPLIIDLLNIVNNLTEDNKNIIFTSAVFDEEVQGANLLQFAICHCPEFVIQILEKIQTLTPEIQRIIFSHIVRTTGWNSLQYGVHLPTVSFIILIELISNLDDATKTTIFSHRDINGFNALQLAIGLRQDTALQLINHVQNLNIATQITIIDNNVNAIYHGYSTLHFALAHQFAYTNLLNLMHNFNHSNQLSILNNCAHDGNNVLQRAIINCHSAVNDILELMSHLNLSTQFILLSHCNYDHRNSLQLASNIHPTNEELIESIRNMMLNAHPAESILTTLRTQPNLNLSVQNLSFFGNNRPEYISAIQTALNKKNIDINELTKYYEKKNSKLIELLTCPITGCLFLDPVTIDARHTFEKSALQEALRHRPGINPLTNVPFNQNLALQTNYVIQDIILSLIEDYKLEEPQNELLRTTMSCIK